MSSALVVMLAFLLLLVAGCAGVGPAMVNRDRFDYTKALADSWKSQMLVNIVKLRYGDAPVFLDVSSVITSYEVSGRGSAGAFWNFNPSYGSGANVGGDIFSANRPTITYSPLTGEKFARSMMTPVPPAAILSLIQSGYAADLVFRMLVHSVNGVRNTYGSRAAGFPADPEFYPLLEKLRRIQQSGAIGLRVQKIDQDQAMLLVFSSKVSEEIAADRADVRKILGVDPAATEFRVVYGLVPSDEQEIAILSRSMLQILVDVSSRIEVPEADVEEKRVAPTVKDVNGSGLPVAPLITIHSSLQRPEDAFVLVPYGHRWFWIDDRDIQSKQIFSFLMFIFTLVETGGKEGAPVVTIPVR